MWLLLLIGFVSGYLFNIAFQGNNVMHEQVQKRTKKEGSSVYVDYLKNGLLAYALLKTTGNHHTGSYDGTRLPPFSGSNIRNTCITYIIEDKQEVKEIEDKRVAIQKYLAAQFDTYDKVVTFFDKFVAAQEKESPLT